MFWYALNTYFDYIIIYDSIPFLLSFSSFFFLRFSSTRCTCIKFELNVIRSYISQGDCQRYANTACTKAFRKTFAHWRSRTNFFRSQNIFIESTAMLCWLNHNDRFVLFWEMLCVFHSSSALFNVCAVLNSCARANRWIDLNLWFVLLCVDDFTAYCWWCAYDNRKHLGSAYYGLLIHFSRKFIWLKCTHLTVWAWTFKLNSEKK